MAAPSPQVQVLPVPEGSIIWLHNVELGDGNVFLEDMLDGLRTAIPHDRHVVLCTHGAGVVEVLGPDDLVARVRAALSGDD